MIFFCILATSVQHTQTFSVPIFRTHPRLAIVFCALEDWDDFLEAINGASDITGLQRVCFFLTLTMSPGGSLVGRLSWEAIAGGRLAHAAPCDRQDEMIYFGHNNANSNCSCIQPQYLAARNGPHLYMHKYETLYFLKVLSYLLMYFFSPPQPWCDEFEMYFICECVKTASSPLPA